MSQMDVKMLYKHSGNIIQSKNHRKWTYKIIDREIKEETETSHFQTAVNLLCMFFHIKSLIYGCICIFLVNHVCFCMYLYLLLLSIVLFMCHFVPPSEVSEGITCLSACASICLPLLLWPFTFTEKSDCKTLSMISLMRNLVKL